MPILSVGKTRDQFSSFSFLVSSSSAPQLEARNKKLEISSGITLVELLVVVALISLMIGISFPAITSGVDSLRLNAATNSIVGFFNSGLNRADRRQQVVEITISRPANALEMRSSEPGFFRKLEMPEGVSITRILPDLPVDPDAPRSFLLYPGSAVPRFGVQLINRKNVERIVRVDPITGVPQVEQPEQ